MTYLWYPPYQKLIIKFNIKSSNQFDDLISNLMIWYIKSSNHQIGWFDILIFSYIRSSNQFDLIFHFISNFDIKYEIWYQIIWWFDISNHQIIKLFDDLMIWYIKSSNQFDFIFIFIWYFHIKSSNNEICDGFLQSPPDWHPWLMYQPRDTIPFDDLMIILTVFGMSQSMISWFDDFPKGFWWFWRWGRPRIPCALQGQNPDAGISWFDDIPKGFR